MPWKNSIRTRNAARAAFEILVREHHRRVLAYARSLVSDHGAAEDIVQEAFLVAWRKLDQFDPKRDFGSWVRGMVRYEYFHWARKRKLIPLEDDSLERIDHIHAQLSEATDHSEDLFDRVRQCVRALPEALRSVVELVYTDGLSCPEIANREDASEVAIRKRLQRGRDQVAACLETKTQIPIAH